METVTLPTPSTAQPHIIVRRGYAFNLYTGEAANRATGYPYTLRRAATNKTPEVARLMGGVEEATLWAETIADIYATVHGEGTDAPETAKSGTETVLCPDCDKPLENGNCYACPYD